MLRNYRNAIAIRVRIDCCLPDRSSIEGYCHDFVLLSGSDVAAVFPLKTRDKAIGKIDVSANRVLGNQVHHRRQGLGGATGWGASFWLRPNHGCPLIGIGDHGKRDGGIQLVGGSKREQGWIRTS